MSKCDFTIDFIGNGEELIRAAEQAISNAGGSFSSTDSEGQFVIKSPMGKISGTFIVLGQSFNISITDKPYLVSCDRIEEELRKQIK